MIKLSILLKNMDPALNKGEYVFCTITDTASLKKEEYLAVLKEKEGLSVILDKKAADRLKLAYNYIAAWITLRVYSPLNSVGLTAAVSNALNKHKIGCNIVAGFHHDHIFVDHDDARNALKILKELSQDKLSS